jgi:ribokinase
MSKVTVVGSINMDVVAVAGRHPRIGETVMGSELHLLPGGKGANQAVAACRAGITTAMVGRVGDDAFADELLGFLEDEQLDLRGTHRLAGAPTGTAVIAVADGQNTIVVVPGANALLAPADVADIDVAGDDVVIAQLEVPQDTITAAFLRAAAVGATTMLNAAPAAVCAPALLQCTDVLVINETELATLSGQDVERAAAMTADEAVVHARALRVRPDQVVVVTLGAVGAIAVAGDDVLRVAGHVVDVVDTTGAGDCFVGNLAAALARGAELGAALAAANLAAASCVQILGAAVSMPRAETTDAPSAAAA